MEKILLAQFIAHIIADFFAQSDSISREKQRNNLSSWHIYVHVLIVFVASLGMTLSGVFLIYAAAITIIHLIIDTLKSFIESWLIKRKKNGNQFYINHGLFFTDQLLHLVVIYCTVAMYWTNNHVIPAYLDLFTINQLLIFTGLLLCMKPVNIVRHTVNSCETYNKTMWPGVIYS